MNELLNVCYFYWVRPTFLLKKCMILMFLMNALQTDRLTDTAYYRDARTHLKSGGKQVGSSLSLNSH